MPEQSAFFEFNKESSILLIGFLQGIIYAILLSSRARRDERIADYFAAGILIVGALLVAQWMLGFAGWYDAHDWRTTLMFYTKWSNVAALGPLIWFYFRSLTNADFKRRRSHWWHFLLWGILSIDTVVIFAYDFIYYALIQGKEFIYFLNTRGPGSEWGNNANVWYSSPLFYLARLQLFVYLLWTILDLRKYQRYVSAEFSNAEQLSLRGFRTGIYILVLGMFGVVVLSLAARYYQWNYQGAWYTFFVMSILIYLGGILFYNTSPKAFRQVRFNPGNPTSLALASAPVSYSIKPPAVEPSALHLWSLKLDEYLATEKAYLQPELSLSELAKSLKTNSSVLSKVINQVHGLNFNDFINSRRCKAFLDKLSKGDHQQKTLLSLAFESGFNSKATFNRAFKKYYGVSPGQAAKMMDKGEAIQAIIKS